MNLGGGANINGTGEGLTGSANGTYGFTDKRQTNFATIGEGNIIIRDESSTGDPEKYNSLKRDVAISQYNTKDGALQGGFTVDADTVNLVTNPLDTATKTITAVADGYRDAKETTGVIYNEAGVAIEKTGNLVGSGHFTTDDKVSTYLSMDEFERKIENGDSVSAQDKLNYYSSKDFVGEELSPQEQLDRNLAVQTRKIEVTSELKQDILDTWKDSTALIVNSKLAVLRELDPAAAAEIDSRFAGIRESERQRTVIIENKETVLAGTNTGLVNEKSSSVRDVIEGWGQALSSWGAERNKEAAVLNKDITNSAIVQSGHRAGEWMNENPDQVLSTITDFTPIIGQGKGVIDAVTGKDLITKEELAGWQRGLSIAGIIPVGKVLDKAGDVVKVVDDIPLKFTQATASPYFSIDGNFSGKSISDVADSLRNGSLSAADVPVEYVVRDGNNLIVNTRSSLSLQQANIPKSEWNMINKTGNESIETNISVRLQRNNLSNQGADVLRITGAGSDASTLIPK